VTRPRDDVVLRATSSVVAFGAVVVVCLVLLADAALRGRWDVVLAALPASGLVVWAGFVVFARPCLRITDSGLSIVNVLRTTDAPWGAVDDVTTRFQAVVLLKDGTRIRSWGAPTSARAPASPRADDRHRDSSGRVTGSAASRVIDDALTRHADDPVIGEVRRTWHRRSILLGAVLAATALIQLVLALAG
jgi:hypothetical protein